MASDSLVTVLGPQSADTAVAALGVAAPRHDES